MVEPLDRLYEEEQDEKGPPEATVARRAKSYSDFCDIVRREQSRNATKTKRRKRKELGLAALLISDYNGRLDEYDGPILDTYEDEFQSASQQDYL